MTATMGRPANALGDQLRTWRQRRRMSQLDLACEAEVSARHLSFVETGRSAPSREMVLRLAEHLAVPMRERNVLLVSAGFAPLFPERSLDDPHLKPAQDAIQLVLESHKPYPAFALDRHWGIAASNSALQVLYEGVAPALMERPVNAIRLSLHPQGLAPRILNLAEWSAHLIHRLHEQIDATGDPVLIALADEAAGYARAGLAGRPPQRPSDGVVIPFRVMTSIGELSFLSTTMVFGTPVDVTLSELMIETFFPADEDTVQRVRRHVQKDA